MTDNELIEEKKKLGAKYCWVDKRYKDNWRHLFLYSDSQKNALFEIMDQNHSLVDNVFQRVCNDDNLGKYTAEEIKNVYNRYLED